MSMLMQCQQDPYQKQYVPISFDEVGVGGGGGIIQYVFKLSSSRLFKHNYGHSDLGLYLSV